MIQTRCFCTVYAATSVSQALSLSDLFCLYRWMWKLKWLLLCYLQLTVYTLHLEFMAVLVVLSMNCWLDSSVSLLNHPFLFGGRPLPRKRCVRCFLRWKEFQSLRTSFSLFIRALEWIWAQSSLWFLLSVLGLLVVMGDFSADEDDTSDITTTVSEIPVLWYQIHQHIHYLVADCDDRTFLFTSFNLYQVGDAINYAYFTDGYGDRMRQLVRYFI